MPTWAGPIQPVPILCWTPNWLSKPAQFATLVYNIVQLSNFNENDINYHDLTNLKDTRIIMILYSSTLLSLRKKTVINSMQFASKQCWGPC